MLDKPNALVAADSEQSDMATPDMESMLARLDEPGDAGDGEAASDQADIEQPSGDDDAAAAAEHVEDTAAEEDGEPLEADAEAEEAPELAEKIHGNTVTRLRDGTEVTVGELKRAYDELREYRSRMPDLTAAAEKAKAFEMREAQFAESEKVFRNIVPLALQILHARIPPEPDRSLLDKMSESYDPVRYDEEWHARRIALAEVQQIHTDLQSYQAQQQKQIDEARAAEARKFLTESRNIVREKIPLLADPEKGKAIYGDIIRTAGQYGIGESEVRQAIDYAFSDAADDSSGGSFVDPRMLHMIHDLSRKAAAYDRLMAQKPKADAKVRDAAPVQRPGRRVSVDDVARQATEERLRRWKQNDNPSIDDVLDIIVQA